jgi:hypothetical protein
VIAGAQGGMYVYYKAGIWSLKRGVYLKG